MSKPKQLKNETYTEFITRSIRELNQFTVQYLPDEDLFHIVGLNLNITRSLQWCRLVIDKLEPIHNWNWFEVMNHPETKFYV